MIKAAGAGAAGQIVFFRSFFAIFPILVVLSFSPHELTGAFATSRPRNHVVAAWWASRRCRSAFFALTRLPLPEAITLNYAQPLLVVVFSAILHGRDHPHLPLERGGGRPDRRRIISWPNLTLFTSGAGMTNDQSLGVMNALGSAAVSAVAMLLVRRLVAVERTATIVLWFSMTASLFALATIPFGWIALSAWQIVFLVGAGVCGGLGQIMMTESYRHAQMSTIAPFEYTSMLLAIAVGYFIFGDLPDRAHAGRRRHRRGRRHLHHLAREPAGAGAGARPARCLRRNSLTLCRQLAQALCCFFVGGGRRIRLPVPTV